MKKLIALLLALSCILSLTGCGSGEKHTIEIIIPAGNTDTFVYSDVEISPQKNTLTISAGAGISSTEVVLKTVEVRNKTAYEPAVLKQREPVRMKVEKDAWFQIGVAIENPADVPIAVSVAVEDVKIRTKDPIAPTGYPSGEIQQPQIMYDGLLYFYCATGFDEPLPAGYDYIGDVEVVDNENVPTADFHGAQVEAKQEIYVLPGIHDTIYVKYENGYARFSLKEEAKANPDPVIIPTLKFLEAAISDDFIDPATVSVRSGEWAYTVDPNRFVALVTVNYINKFDEYETADYVVLGTFGADAGTRHCLNQHSPYTRENVLQHYGALDHQSFPLE